MKVFCYQKILPFRDHLARRALFQFEFVIQNFFQFLVSAHLTLLLAAHESEYETVRPRYLSSPTHTVGDLGVCSGDLVDYSQNQGTQWDPVAHAQMKINIA